MQTDNPIEPLVSLREFARMTGTSDGAVRKAIGRGSIKEGFVDGKIRPSVASVEWGKGILEVGSPKSDIGSQKPKDFAGYEKIESDETDVPVTESVPLVYTGDEDVLNDTTDKAEFLRDIPQNTTKIEAERLYSVFKARKAKRELQEKEGELVDKGLVYKNLFEFAAIIRDKFINVPDRVIDNIRAAETRNEALIILSDEIAEVFKSLTNIGEIKLTKED